MKKQFEFLIYLPLAAISNYASMHVLPGYERSLKEELHNNRSIYIYIYIYIYSDGNVY